MKPVVDRLEQRYGDRIEFRIYSDVNNDPVALELARVHGVAGVPTMMLVDSAGREIERWMGPVPDADLSAALDEVLE